MNHGTANKMNPKTNYGAIEIFLEIYRYSYIINYVWDWAIFCENV